MRYENWDVVLESADGSEIPFKEFKTECHITQDPEMLDCQNKPPYMPTVTCFTPSLHEGTPFIVSVHSWERPQPSHYFQWESKAMVWEIRLFIDGVSMGARFCSSEGPWPLVIHKSSVLDRNGEQELLKFPRFHQELINQSYWNAGDDFGRIQVVITEGAQNLTTPPINIERLRNVVSFSFQHAPLSVLESSAIAWPNAAMWRPVSSATALFTQPYFQQYVEGVQRQYLSPHTRQVIPNMSRQVMLPASVTTFSQSSVGNCFNSAFHRWRQSSSSDVSMRDYSTRATNSRQFTDPMSIVGESVSGAETPEISDLCKALQSSSSEPPLALEKQMDHIGPRRDQNVRGKDTQDSKSAPEGPPIRGSGIPSPMRSCSIVNGKRQGAVTPILPKGSEDKSRDLPCQEVLTVGSARKEDREQATSGKR